MLETLLMAALVPRWAERPLLKGKQMDSEPVLFIQQAGSAVATGRLVFTPTKPPILRSPDLDVTYKEGIDYRWKPGSSTIELIEGSQIPFKTHAEMVPPKGSANTLMGVLFSEGRYFHDLQVLASYPHKDSWPLKSPPTQGGLIRTLARLRAKNPLKIVALGDSITEGYNASGFAKSLAPPHQPAYPGLVAEILQKRFSSKVTLANLGVAGTTADWGLTQVPKLAEEKPDLVILAFGMNHSQAGPEFEDVMRKLCEAVKTACPNADLILVASMTGNPIAFPTERFIGYRHALSNLVSSKISLADVTTPWLELLKHKNFSDISGNNINHPNDFGHRLYAEVICQLLHSNAR
ncbi:MAG: SGNH/GDSL hydrolase family protein [Fimbriimonadaceae bacterium]